MRGFLIWLFIFGLCLSVEAQDPFLGHTKEQIKLIIDCPTSDGLVYNCGNLWTFKFKEGLCVSYRFEATEDYKETIRKLLLDDFKIVKTVSAKKVFVWVLQRDDITIEVQRGVFQVTNNRK